MIAPAAHKPTRQKVRIHLSRVGGAACPAFTTPASCGKRGKGGEPPRDCRRLIVVVRRRLQGGHDRIAQRSGSCPPTNISSFAADQFIRRQISNVSPELLCPPNSSRLICRVGTESPRTSLMALPTEAAVCSRDTLLASTVRLQGSATVRVATRYSSAMLLEAPCYSATVFDEKAARPAIRHLAKGLASVDLLALSQLTPHVIPAVHAFAWLSHDAGMTALVWRYQSPIS